MAEIYYIDVKNKFGQSAGSKAPADIAALCAKRGCREVPFAVFPVSKGKLYKKCWLMTTGVLQWKRLYDRLQEGDTVIVQHPFYGKRISLAWIRKARRIKKARFVVLIHDLESLRGGIEGVIANRSRTNTIGDRELLQEFDAVICHNQKMHTYLTKTGLDEKKLVDLQIFDYLGSAVRKERKRSSVPSIAIAGNLAPGKCGYIYQLGTAEGNRGLQINLYGKHFDEKLAGPGVQWHGSFEPEELASVMEGDFGLVWDGPSTDGCQGNTGAYLRYNNPHKTSLYLSAGMPVIVWKEAAIADFVLSRGAGLALDRIDDLTAVLGSVTDEEYSSMCAAAANIAEELHDGFYFNRALDEALDLISRENG
ncbi:MAG: hypothetical protein Q4B09_04050 [Lachnospiraceae bacterium]|nr:hypothetical protein [Lachnospiraceae bacterium]